MKYDRMNRRMFLQGTGTLLAVPFLPSLFSSTAKAATILPKYVGFNSNLTQIRSMAAPLGNPMFLDYKPKSVDPNAVPWTQVDSDTKTQDLAKIIALEGQMSYVYGTNWSPFASRTNIVSNVHAYVSSNNHNISVPAACASATNSSTTNGDMQGPGDAYCYSVDYLIEQAFARVSASPLPSLRINLYDNDGGYDSFCFGTINGKPTRLPMMQSLAELNVKLNGVTGIDPSSQKTLNRISRMDSVLSDFKKLMNHRRISSDDKQRLSQAGDMWSSLEKNLKSGGASNACTVPNLASAFSGNYTVQHKAALDALALSLACGLTRVGSYGLIQGGDSQNDQGTMHGWEHDPAFPGNPDPSILHPYIKDIVPWRSQLVTYFLTKLDSYKDENGGSLLDSSVVSWAHQFSDTGHGMLGHVLVSAGGAGGRLITGLHIDGGGAPVNRFHLTNMKAVGLSQADIEANGKPGFGEVATPISTGDGSNAVITEERDYKTNDPDKRHYDTSKLAHFQDTIERRKAFSYLKGA